MIEISSSASTVGVDLYGAFSENDVLAYHEICSQDAGSPIFRDEDIETEVTREVYVGKEEIAPCSPDHFLSCQDHRNIWKCIDKMRHAQIHTKFLWVLGTNQTI